MSGLRGVWRCRCQGRRILLGFCASSQNYYGEQCQQHPEKDDGKHDYARIAHGGLDRRLNRRIYHGWWCIKGRSKSAASRNRPHCKGANCKCGIPRRRPCSTRCRELRCREVSEVQIFPSSLYSAMRGWMNRERTVGPTVPIQPVRMSASGDAAQGCLNESVQLSAVLSPMCAPTSLGTLRRRKVRPVLLA